MNDIVNQDNLGINYVTIPLEAFQSLGDPVTVAHNVIIDAEGQIHILNTQTVDALDPQATFYIDVPPQLLLNEPTNTSAINVPETIPESLNKSTSNEVRYLKCKIDQKTAKKPIVKPNDKKSTRPIKCLLCDTTFLKVSKYRLHMQDHRNDKKYKCVQCKESFNIENNYKVHVALHAKGDSICPICHRKFARWASLKSHLTVHLVDETFTCTECLSEFDKEEELNQHFENQHSMPEAKVISEDPLQLLTCVYCKYLFQDTNALKEHVKLHVKTKKLTFKKKIKRRVSTKEYSHKCEFCQKTFSKVCLLERHRRIHTGDKPFVCPKCKKGFSQKGTLQIHINKHDGMKPYHCLFCSAKFTQKGNLRVHLEKTHSAGLPGEKLYKCTHCTCIFKKVASLNAHQSKHHTGSIKENNADIGVLIENLKDLNELATPKATINNGAKPKQAENLNAPGRDEQHFVKLAESSQDGTIRRYVFKQRRIGDVNWYMCSYCVREFKKPSDLIRHIRIHTNEKPFRCELCSQTFSVKSSLINHMNIHSEKEYVCVYCNSPYSSLRALNVHLRLHDKNAVATISRPFKCSVCHITFTTEEKANAHLSLHTADGIPPVLTKFPNFDVALKQPLMVTKEGMVPISPPKQTMQPNKNRKFKCHLCDGMFLKAAHLKRHELTHTKNIHACPLCERSFSSESRLKEHTKNHTREKNIQCNFCTKMFYTNYSMLKHMSVHNTNSPFICSYCSKEFKSAYYCRVHIKTIHKEEIIKANKMNEENDSNKTFLATDITSNLVETFKCENNISAEADPYVDAITNSNIDDQSKIEIISTENNEQANEQNIDNGENSEEPLDNNQPNLNEQISDVTENDISIQTLGADGISYPSIFTITAEELRSLGNTNVVNALLPQLKLQNTDPLLQCSINELQEATSFPLDASLIQDQGAQSYEDDQTYDTFNPNLIFQTSINELTENLTDKDIEAGTTNANDPNKPNQVTFTNAQIDLELNRLAGQKTDTIMHENLTILNNDPLKSNELNYFINFAHDDYIDINSLNITDGSIGKLIEGQNFNVLEHISIAKDPQLSKENEDDAKNAENDEVSQQNDVADLPAETTSEDTSVTIDATEKSDVIIEIDKTGVETDNICTGTSLENKVKPKSKKERLRNEEIKNKPFVCQHCKERFKLKVSMLRHISAKHKETISLSCRYCKKVFKKRTDLDRHHRTHTGEKPFRCEKCEKSFSLKSTLASHYKTHNPLGYPKEFRCPVCDAFLSAKSSLTQHIKNHSQIKPYTCELCPLRFRTAIHKKHHLNTHLNGKTRLSTVNLLESILMQTNVDLQNEANESTVITKYTVGKEDQAATSLIANELTEENLELANAIDPILLQINSDTYNPEIGIQIEINGQIINVKPDLPQSGVNLYSTDDIQPSNNNEELDNLQSVIIQTNDIVHEKSALDNDLSDTMQYDNDYINLKTGDNIGSEDNYMDLHQDPDYMDDNNFMELQQIDSDNVLSQNNVLQHDVILHEEDTTIQNENLIHIRDVSDILQKQLAPQHKRTVPKLQCEQCMKFYVTKTVLTKHIKRVHRSIPCPKCSKAFDTYDDMERHHKLHFGYRPYSCSLCPNSFVDEPGLRTHLRRIHNHSSNSR